MASELYHDVLRESELGGLYSEEELLQFLVDNDFWDQKRQSDLEIIPKQIEDSKVALFSSSFKSNERAVIRKALGLAKAEFVKLTNERHQYDYLSCSGAAGIAQTRYLVGIGLHTLDGRPVFNDISFWGSSSSILDDVMSAYSSTRIDESHYRELARTEPWRSFWNAAKVEHCLFGTPPVDWTDDQKTLVNWSMLYDNVYNHPDCPGDKVIEDDDLLDGWLIVQRRNREKGMNELDGEKLLKNEKIRNSQEVFLIAETQSDADKVINLNGDVGKALMKSRLAQVAKKGTVTELEMPDTAARLRQEIAAHGNQVRKK